MKAYHIATHTANIGDAALVNGIQSTIKQDISPDIYFQNDCLMSYENYWGDKKYDEHLVKTINNNYDFLIIGGGGMIDGQKARKELGIGFDMPFSLLKKIKVPIIFYALGFNLFRNQKFYNKSSLINLLEYTKSNNSIIFSVRDDGSLKKLEKFLGKDLTCHIHSIPDPGLYIKNLVAENEEMDQKKNYIGLQLAGDNIEYRLTPRYISKYKVIGRTLGKLYAKKSISRLSKCIESICTNSNYQLLLCPHLIKDIKIYNSFISNLSNKFIREKVTSTSILKGTEHAADYFKNYKKCSLIIGMRGHSAICSVGLSVPFIGLNTHDKVSSFMNLLGLNRYLIKMNDKTYETKIYDLINEITLNPSIVEKKLMEINQNSRKKTSEFNLKIKALLQ